MYGGRPYAAPYAAVAPAPKPYAAVPAAVNAYAAPGSLAGLAQSAYAGIPKAGPILTDLPNGNAGTVPAIKTDYGKSLTHASIFFSG